MPGGSSRSSPRKWPSTSPTQEPSTNEASSLFTNPQLLSLTAAATDNTQKFASILASAAAANSNLTSRQTGPSLDLTPRITVFIPSDAAFAAANAAANSVSGSGAQKLVDGHVVVAGSIADPVGYLPELKSGQVLQTKAGGSLTVSVGGDGSYYVNGAKIEKANIILPNGVAHVVDKVCLTAAMWTMWANTNTETGAFAAVTDGGCHANSGRRRCPQCVVGCWCGSSSAIGLCLEHDEEFEKQVDRRCEFWMHRAVVRGGSNDWKQAKRLNCRSLICQTFLGI